MVFQTVKTKHAAKHGFMKFRLDFSFSRNVQIFLMFFGFPNDENKTTKM